MGTWDIEVFFDGACPLCRREINLLRRWDKRQRIRFTDIAAAGFDPQLTGKTLEDLMARIHGRLPDGTLIEGVEVFRRLYTAAGFRWLVAITRLPGLSSLLNLGYRLFAANRLRLTGRCREGVCELPAASESSSSDRQVVPLQ
jgi:predicted DCC family thiol-disulfide oxidoreductase YuxK